jgi:DNA polymerase V
MKRLQFFDSSRIYRTELNPPLVECPLVCSQVAAGFPSPAEDYIEGRIDLNKELIRHPFSTFHIRVRGDSMEPLICSGELLVVDRMPETADKDIVVARIGNDLCVKRLRISDDGAIYLHSENPAYKPIRIDIEDDFEVWGLVLHSIKTFKRCSL